MFRLQGQPVLTVPAPLARQIMPSSASLVPLLSVSVPVLNLGISFARRSSPHSPSSANQTHYAILLITSPIIVSFCSSFEPWYFVCKESLSSRSQLHWPDTLCILCITSPISSITAIFIVSFCFSFGHSPSSRQHGFRHASYHGGDRHGCGRPRTHPADCGRGHSRMDSCQCYVSVLLGKGHL